MPTPFASLAATLLATLHDAAGVAVTFSRGASSVAITATPGQSVIDVAAGDNRAIQVMSNDWLVLAADLVIDAAVVKPRRGDKVTDAAGVIYELMDPPYKPMNAAQTALRLFSKKVGRFVSSRIATVADALTSALNAASLSQAFVAVRSYRPEYELDDMGSLHVSVIPAPVTREQIARSLIQRTYQVVVLVQQKVADESNASIDPLTQLCEEIADFVTPGQLGTSGATWISTEHDPIYDPEHMKEMRLFTNVVVFTFRF